MNKAVFLDRDGVIIEEQYGVFINKPEQVKIIPKSAMGIGLLKKAGYDIYVVTNQGGIALGFIDEEILGEIHRKMEIELSLMGACIDGIVYCPHHPKVSECQCRKPNPYLLQGLAMHRGLDLEKCWMIGDRATDIECGTNAGCKTILVMTGDGRRSFDYIYWGDQANSLVTAKDLYGAAEYIRRFDSYEQDSE